MAKLKIGFFIDEYTPGAGTENQVRGILKEIDRSRYEAVLVSLHSAVLEADQKDLNWPVHHIGVNKLVSPISMVKFCRFVGWLKEQKFDIALVFFQDTNLFVVPACHFAGVKAVVVNRRDMGFWHSRGSLVALKLVNRWADYCLVNAQAVKEIVVAREKFPADRVKVIYNGLWNWKSAAAPVSRTELEIQPGSRIVGIVAGLRAVKRVDRFVAMAEVVARQFPETCFLVLGDGECRDELVSQAQRLGLETSIRFLGQVTDVRPYLSLLDVGVLTSESEGLSNTLIEYGASGVPAVAFDTGGNREVILDGETGYLAPDGDVSRLAAKVVAILTDNELRRRLSVRSIESVQKRFSPDAIYPELTAFFDAIS